MYSFRAVVHRRRVKAQNSQVTKEPTVKRRRIEKQFCSLYRFISNGLENSMTRLVQVEEKLPCQVHIAMVLHETGADEDHAKL